MCSRNILFYAKRKGTGRKRRKWRKPKSILLSFIIHPFAFHSLNYFLNCYYFSVIIMILLIDHKCPFFIVTVFTYCMYVCTICILGHSSIRTATTTTRVSSQQRNVALHLQPAHISFITKLIKCYIITLATTTQNIGVSFSLNHMSSFYLRSLSAFTYAWPWRCSAGRVYHNPG